jgi:biopolymer transport protein TolQ
VQEPLSVFHLISNASLLVQFVMLLLFTASMVSWYMIYHRWRYYAQAQQSLEAFEDRFWSGGDLGDLYHEGSRRSDTAGIEGVENIFRAGFREFTRLSQKQHADPDAIMEGVQRAMRVALSKEEDKLERHLPFLASTGSTSPYVGLFGTVWGIMNSFRGLANSHQATLATVAPGISEALVATAMGLFAAIPAVLAYNHFSNRVDSLSGRYETFAEEFSAILHRQVHAQN